ncbi:MAG: glycosyltransferase family 4 protein [Anaerolineaceae bacterium]|nr:glycosyltransferase family 4 protein [Anaerolineaceae bacterium]
MIRVLVVGQVPPPYTGQSVMIEKMIQGQYKQIKIVHINMAFSNSIEEIGRFHLSKIRHLVKVIVQIWQARLRFKPDILYYPPSGPNRIPIYRDILILLATRWLFPKIVFHFHAGGISQLYPNLPKPIRLLFRLAYMNANAGIRLADKNPPDSTVLGLKRDFIVPYGIDDAFVRYGTEHFPNNYTQILFVGMLRESKGIFVLLDACRQLKEQGYKFKLKLVGGVDSEFTSHRIKDFLTTHNLSKYVEMTGILTGTDKWQAYSTSNIFCFPSYYESETFGLVVLEAMQFSLPVVATDWRGISTLIDDGQTGFLVKPHNSVAVAQKLSYLIEHPDQAKAMGKKGRQKYLTSYTTELYWQNIENVFITVAT